MDEQFKWKRDVACLNYVNNKWVTAQRSVCKDGFVAGVKWAYTERQKEIDELKAKLAIAYRALETILTDYSIGDSADDPVPIRMAQKLLKEYRGEK